MHTLQAKLGPDSKHIGWRGLYPCPQMGRGKEAGQGSVSWKGWKSGVEMQPEIIVCPRAGSLRRRTHLVLAQLLPGEGTSTPTPLHMEKTQHKDLHQKVWSKVMLPLSGFQFKPLLNFSPKCWFLLLSRRMLLSDLTSSSWFILLFS